MEHWRGCAMAVRAEQRGKKMGDMLPTFLGAKMRPKGIHQCNVRCFIVTSLALTSRGSNEE